MMCFLYFGVVMLYFVTIFLSALLLFLVQPMIAKVILPSFGGGAAVWTTCMLFFQCLLLGGYCYAHGLITFFKPKRQLLIHGSLILVALILTPISVELVDINDSPQLTILVILLASIGLPYFVLSANAPLIQRWFAYENKSLSPYKLYALSNIGSLIGLLLYPFAVEPFISLDNQLILWSIGYWSFTICCILLTGKLFLKSKSFNNISSTYLAPSKLLEKVLWILLSSIGVVALLAVTSSMSQNISSIPFLWLLPLVLYLVSFIVCFANDTWISRKVWYGALLLSLPITFLLYFFASLFPLLVQLLLYSFVLFSVCMVCHGELVRLKPAAHNLTAYYLAMSVGGVVGGLFVSFIAPALFDQFIEFPLIVWICFVIGSALSWYKLVVLRAKILWGALSITLTSAGLFVFINNLYQQYDVTSGRNFYGQLAVKDIKINNLNERRLVDGTTSHGTQSLYIKESQIPLSYYRANTGVAVAIKALQQRVALNVSIIGLGAGTLASYGRINDSYHFLELNPMVSEYAHRYFTYIDNSKADVKVTIGDGRSLLSNNQLFNNNELDLLVVDAFSSDAIPTHLLTVEAMMLYKERIKEEGIIALHISNSHLDLIPLVYGVAQELSLSATFVLTAADAKNTNMAQWVLLAKDASVLNESMILDVKTKWPKNIHKPIIWTDDYSNLLSVLK